MRHIENLQKFGLLPIVALNHFVHDTAEEIAVVEAVCERFGARCDIEALGYGHLLLCIAKTQFSFSTDPALVGAPSGHIAEVREVRLSAGAGFIVAICGDIMVMPGLPRSPAAVHIGLEDDGNIVGLA